MAGIVEQLAGMNTAIPNELAIALLIASIHVSEMAPISAAIKTMPDDSASWEAVTIRLIEEQHSLKIRTRSERTAMAAKHCEICEKNHFTKDCWLNSKNPNNRLQLREKPGKDIKEKKNQKKSDKKSDSTKQKSSNPKTPRAAVARANVCNISHERRMMLDSGTTTHMTPDEDEVLNTVNCNVSISLDDESCLQANSRGTNAVIWNGPDGTTEVHLSETLAARDLAMKLLSVPALTKKGMAVLFLPSKALIVDLRDNYKVIGVAPKQDDGLYYIGTDGSDHVGTGLSTTDRAMMALVRQFTETDEPSDKESSPTTDDTPCSSNDEDTSDEHTDDVDYNMDSYSVHHTSDKDDSRSSNDAECYSTDTEKSDADNDELTLNLCVMAKATEGDAAVWHNRLGHQGTPTEFNSEV